ncbi:MAG: FMN-binding protein [Ruminococcaceae bacterium]|nr:FMN-binding protein [Oscillospiraceae bacterium]
MLQMKKNDNIFVLAIKLFVICLVVALGLSALNYVTKPIIDELTESKKAEAMQSVLSDCELEKFSDAVYVGIENGEIKGYAVNVVTPEGYGGDIELIVGFDADFNVTGVEYISMSETPGLGSRAKEEPFASQFNGKPAQDFSEIQAMTGATVTSKAVNGAINQASDMAKEAKEAKETKEGAK